MKSINRPLTIVAFVFLWSLVAITNNAAGQNKKQRPRKTPSWRCGGQMIPDVARDQVICFALYTVEDGTLKLSAQLYPLREGEPRKINLLAKVGDAWEIVAVSAARRKIIRKGPWVSCST